MKNMKYFSLVLLLGVTLNCLAQDEMLCIGHHWTQDEANLMMKKFAGTWNSSIIFLRMKFCWTI